MNEYCGCHHLSKTWLGLVHSRFKINGYHKFVGYNKICSLDCCYRVVCLVATSKCTLLVKGVHLPKINFQSTAERIFDDESDDDNDSDDYDDANPEDSTEDDEDDGGSDQDDESDDDDNIERRGRTTQENMDSFSIQLMVAKNEHHGMLFCE